jgi:hypothetical protein
MAPNESNKDAGILRDLAKQVAAIAAKPIQDERRDLWRRHNSLQRTRPLIYTRWFACAHEIVGPRLQCADPFFRAHEYELRQLIFQDGLDDDYIIEPWITQRATHVTPPNGPWGLPYGRIPSTEPGGAWKYDPPIKKLEDAARMVRPRHAVDEQATARNVARLRDAVGDIMEVNVSRSPLYSCWNSDISTDLGYLRDIGQVMWDMMDNPAWLHRLVKFMSDAILSVQEEAEAAGDWRLGDHENQAMSYALELADPRANSRPVKRKDLWCFCAAQEMAQVSPTMHDEFILQYQLPIIEKFGLVAYGCCENLTNKIQMLRQIPNLRRIAVTPWADVRKCAEQIGEDYVLSWRPSPANMVCVQFDPDYIRRITRDALDASRGCHVDITLKDVQTVQGDPGRLRRWVEIVRSEADRCG